MTKLERCRERGLYTTQRRTKTHESSEPINKLVSGAAAQKMTRSGHKPREPIPWKWSLTRLTRQKATLAEPSMLALPKEMPVGTGDAGQSLYSSS